MNAECGHTVFLSPDEISRLIWASKYRIHNEQGAAEGCIEESFARVARALAENETPSSKSTWERVFLQCMADFEFLPAGRILRNAGRAHGGTLVSTFAMPPLSPCNWLGAAKIALRTMVAGGGIGVNFQKDIRSDAESGSLRRNLAFWQSIASKAAASPEGRAAMIGLVAADHPEIRDFINAKTSIGDLNQFNLSVLLSADSLERDDPLLSEICDSIIDTGEPGVLFIDNVAEADNLRHIEEIVGTNSCCEQPLPAFGSSPLGSVNLVKFVRHPCTDAAAVDFERLDRVVRVGIRMLDNVIELARYPTATQACVAQGTRRIGLGIMGLDDALRMLGVEYGSDASLKWIATLLDQVRSSSYAASIELAVIRGAFPLFGGSRFGHGPGRHGVESSGYDKLFDRHGIRNGALTAIAPAGSLALLAGNVSAGIEPTYAANQRRIIRIGGVAQTFDLRPYWAYRTAPAPCDRQRTSTKAQAGAYATDIPASTHVQVVAQAQRFIDGGISKTVNLPPGASAAEVKAAILLGHAFGVKGLSFYRENCRRSPVLSCASE